METWLRGTSENRRCQERPKVQILVRGDDEGNGEFQLARTIAVVSLMGYNVYNDILSKRSVLLACAQDGKLLMSDMDFNEIRADGFSCSLNESSISTKRSG